MVAVLGLFGDGTGINATCEEVIKSLSSVGSLPSSDKSMQYVRNLFCWMGTLKCERRCIACAALPLPLLRRLLQTVLTCSQSDHVSDETSESTSVPSTSLIRHRTDHGAFLQLPFRLCFLPCGFMAAKHSQPKQCKSLVLHRPTCFFCSCCENLPQSRV